MRFIKEYVRVSTIGRDEENADQYLLHAKETWFIINDKVENDATQDGICSPWNEKNKETKQKLLCT